LIPGISYMPQLSPDCDFPHRDDAQRVSLKHEVAVLSYLGSNLGEIVEEGIGTCPGDEQVSLALAGKFLALHEFQDMEL